jgi:hypothetical protein
MPTCRRWHRGLGRDCRTNKAAANRQPLKLTPSVGISPQLAAANAKDKPTDPGKRPNGPNPHGAKPPAKVNAAQTAAKNKNEHPKKPGGKDVKQDREKSG